MGIKNPNTKQSSTTLAADVSNYLAARFNGLQDTTDFRYVSVHGGAKRGWRRYMQSVFPDFKLFFKESKKLVEITEVPFRIFSHLYSGPTVIDSSDIIGYFDELHGHAEPKYIKELCNQMGFVYEGLHALYAIASRLDIVTTRQMKLSVDKEVAVRKRCAKFAYDITWVRNSNYKNLGYFRVKPVQELSANDLKASIGELLSFGAILNDNKSDLIFIDYPVQLSGV